MIINQSHQRNHRINLISVLQITDEQTYRLLSSFATKIMIYLYNSVGEELSPENPEHREAMQSLNDLIRQKGSVSPLVQVALCI